MYNKLFDIKPKDKEKTPKKEKAYKKFEVLLESKYTGLSKPVIVEIENESKLIVFIKKQYKHWSKVWFRPFGNKKYISVINNI